MFTCKNTLTRTWGGKPRSDMEDKSRVAWKWEVRLFYRTLKGGNSMKTISVIFMVIYISLGFFQPQMGPPLLHGKLRVRLICLMEILVVISHGEKNSVQFAFKSDTPLDHQAHHIDIITIIQ